MKTLSRLPEPSSYGHFFFKEDTDDPDVDAPAILLIQSGPHTNEYMVTLGNGHPLWNKKTGYFQTFDSPQQALRKLRIALRKPQ